MGPKMSTRRSWFPLRMHDIAGSSTSFLLPDCILNRDASLSLFSLFYFCRKELARVAYTLLELLDTNHIEVRNE